MLTKAIKNSIEKRFIKHIVTTLTGGCSLFFINGDGARLGEIKTKV